MSLPMNIACPNWQEDGPWGQWLDLEHTRVCIGLPLPMSKLEPLVAAFGKCACGEGLVMLCYDPVREPPPRQRRGAT